GVPAAGRRRAPRPTPTARPHPAGPVTRAARRRRHRHRVTRRPTPIAHGRWREALRGKLETHAAAPARVLRRPPPGRLPRAGAHRHASEPGVRLAAGSGRLRRHAARLRQLPPGAALSAPGWRPRPPPALALA